MTEQRLQIIGLFLTGYSKLSGPPEPLSLVDRQKLRRGFRWPRVRISSV